MNNSEKTKLATDTVNGAIAGGMIGGATGIATGVAMTTVTTTSWWIFTTTATVIAPWAVAGCVVGGAAIAGIASAIKSKRDIDYVNEHFENKE